MIKLFRQYFSGRKIIYIIGEGFLIFSAVTLTTYLLLGRGVGLLSTLELVWHKVLLVTLVTQLSLYFNDLYEFKVHSSPFELASRLIQAIGTASIILAVIYYLWPEIVVGRWIFFSSLIILLLFLASWRFIYTIIIRKKLFTEKAVILGSGELASNILDEIKSREDLSFNITMRIAHENGRENMDKDQDVRISYGFDQLCELIEKEDASSVIVALEERRGIFPYKQLLDCKLRGINILDGVSFYERITGKLLVEKINPSFLIFSDGFVKSATSRLVKRFFGLFLSTVMLIFLSPIMLLTAIIIKLESPGPVLFKQERVGEYGKIFTLLKFRSMRSDAETASGPVWASEDDPRITRVGSIIRKMRIDELPQMWNVFTGSMSFVGPRPERLFFVEQLTRKIPYYNERHCVKPGVTGWAQIRYPYGATEKDALEKLKFDLYYIKNLSFAFDLMIIFHTIKIVLLGRGSR
jgi:sugar transferase (PEP-CTERM system associated)